MNINEVVKKYTKIVYKICYDSLSFSNDIEDITQETFISFYKHIDEYGNLDENQIKNIICKIALNKCRDYLKSKITRQNYITDVNTEALESYMDENNMDEKIFNMQKKKLVLEAINRLKGPYKNLVYDYYINQATLDEIAIKTRTSKGTVKTQMYRAKIKLKEELEKNGGVNYSE